MNPYVEEFKNKIENEKQLPAKFTEKVENKVVQYQNDYLERKEKNVRQLAEKISNAEMAVLNKQVDGKKKVLEAEIDKNTTKAKIELDAEKHKRAETILKAQGLTEKMPTAYRVTALTVGYPFFLVYMLTFGWVIQVISFVTKGIVIMIFDCAGKYADLQAKFISNGNNRSFSVGKALFSIFKWCLIIAGIITAVVLIV